MSEPMTEARARDILAEYIQPDGSLYDADEARPIWRAGEDSVLFFGRLHREQVEAILVWTRAKR